MRKGISNLLLILIVMIFLGVPVLFFVISNKDSFSEDNVQGVSTTEVSTKKNFYVTVDSPTGSWQLMQYLCSDVDTCLESLTAGTELASVSGGASENNQVMITEAFSWSDFSYLKVFVRSGWGMDESSYVISNIGDIPGTQKSSVESTGDEFEVAIIPISSLGYQTLSSVTFTETGYGSFSL